MYFVVPCPSDAWTSNNSRAGRGQQSNLTSCLFHQIFSNHLFPLSIRCVDQQYWPCRTRPAEQLDIMPFPSDFLQSLVSLVHQMRGPAILTVPDEASRATWHHAFSIRFSPITCFPCPSDAWTSNTDRAGRGQQSNLTSCLFHQIFSNHLFPLSIRCVDQQYWPCRTRPAEQLDIMPFPSDFLQSLVSLVHQMRGPAILTVPDEASRATWHHAFSIRFFQITCFPCPSDAWTSNTGRAGRGQQSNFTSCLFHQILSNDLYPLSIRCVDQQYWPCRTRPAEQLDIMPFPSDSVKLLAFLVHQMRGPAILTVPDEASRATWHHAFSIRFCQITSFPCPSDAWTSNTDRAGRGQQSNLTSCLFRQIFSNHLFSLSIRCVDQQYWPCRTRPAEQLDIMPFPSDFLQSLVFLVHQMRGPAILTVPDEASRATWHHAFSIRFSPITCFPCPSDAWTSNTDRAGRGQQSNFASCLFHQIPSNDLWGWGNQREIQSSLASRSNLLSHRDENLYFTWFYKCYFHVGTTHCDHLSYMFSWHSLGRSLKVSSSLCFSCPSDSNEVRTALVAAETSVATWHDGIAMLGQLELKVHMLSILILNDLGPKKVLPSEFFRLCVFCIWQSIYRYLHCVWDDHPVFLATLLDQLRKRHNLLSLGQENAHPPPPHHEYNTEYILCIDETLSM